MIVNDWIHVIAGIFILLTVALGSVCRPQPLSVRLYKILSTGNNPEENRRAGRVI
jgi:hypothetical protein